jgi:regulator of PEP synthase PpsR (kinase-PPPase family)
MILNFFDRYEDSTANSGERICDVYMISDSSGETVSVVLRAVAAQLVGVRIEGHLYPLVKSYQQIDEVLNHAQEQNGVILCTMADDDLFDYLVQNAKRRKLVCIEILSKIIKELARYFEVTIDRGARQSYMESDYFCRINAINFTLEHDDGQGLDSISKADIILVGVSRSSKSPTSVYLANRGYKVANIPFIPSLENPLPEELLKANNKLIVALSIDSDRLMSVRKQRMKHMHHDLRVDYVDIKLIVDENRQANTFYNKMGWPAVDVTDRSVEEIAAMIIQYHNRYNNSIEEQ